MDCALDSVLCCLPPPFTFSQDSSTCHPPTHSTNKPTTKQKRTAAIAAAEAEAGAEAAASGNGTIPDSIKQSYKADLALLKKSAERIGRTLKDVQRKQMKERHRLALQTAANERNHNKMVVSSLFETVVFIGVSVFQLFYVRRWFEGRGLQGQHGGRGGSRQWA